MHACVFVWLCWVCPWDQGLCLWERIRWHWDWHSWWGRWHCSFPGSSALLSIMMFRAMCSPVPKICSIAFVEVSWGYHHEGKWNLDCLQPLEVQRGEDQWSDGKQGRQTHKDSQPSDLETVVLSCWTVGRNVLWSFGFNYASDETGVNNHTVSLDVLESFYEMQCVKLWGVKYSRRREVKFIFYSFRF